MDTFRKYFFLFPTFLLLITVVSYVNNWIPDSVVVSSIIIVIILLALVFVERKGK